MNNELPLSLPPRNANRLTLTQTFALGTWIKDHEPQAKDDTDAQGAQHAALDLGFTVTAANFTAARQALGIDKTKPAAPPTVEDRLTELESITKGLLTQSVMDHTRVTTMRAEIDTHIARIDQTLVNLRHGYDDLLRRLIRLEQRFHTESQPTPIHPGRMATEMPTIPSDTEGPTPAAN